MTVLLVGTDYEENLGLAMVAASLTRAGHAVEVVAFNEASELERVAQRVVSRTPNLVGLGIQFQHRALDFFELGRRLRCLGFRGHITCGGQYPTMAFGDLLAHEAFLDSVALHEAEHTIVELARAVDRSEPLSTVSGLAFRDANDRVVKTSPRPMTADLDALPFAHRYREHSRHLKIPFIPISASRGCWGSCAFCSITTTYRTARAQTAGRLLRLRSPASVAAEMALLWHEAGGRCIFCFHDDTLLLPRPSDTLVRLTELRRGLDKLGVGEVGLIGKCRPDCLTEQLALDLRRLGVVRLFVGIENGSQSGLDHLARRTRVEQLDSALTAAGNAGIMVCYNLLLFEPDATLEDVRDNIAFIRRHPSVPVNFCRAEAYHGTPLFERLRNRGALFGSYLGWDYRISDDRTELAYRIAAAAFRERNFAPDGVANRCMGLAYLAQLLRVFFDPNSPRVQRLLTRTDTLVRDISLDTAALLEQVVDMASGADLADHERITRQTAQLALIVAAHNRLSLVQLNDLRADIEAFAAEQSQPRREAVVPERVRVALNRLAAAGCVMAATAACGGDEGPGAGTGGGSGTGGSVVADPAPGGSGGAIPASGGTGGLIAGDGGAPNTGGISVVDCAPGGSGGFISGDGGAPNTGGISVVDCAPGGSGGFISGDGGAPSTGGIVGDTASGGTGGLVSGDGGAPNTGGISVIDCAPNATTGVVDVGLGQWRNTGPQRVPRSQDLPLFEPPDISLQGRRIGKAWEVTLAGGPAEMTVRWSSEEGSIEGEGRTVSWLPASPDDQLAVAVRTAGGIAVATFRPLEG